MAYDEVTAHLVRENQYLRNALESILRQPQETMSDGKALSAIVRIARAALKAKTFACVQALPDFKGYTPDGPVGMALEWLSSALKSPAFQWDSDQREYAEKSLKDAEQWLAELMHAHGVQGTLKEQP